MRQQKALIVTVRPDPDVGCPNDNDGWWKVVSFSRRHKNSGNLDDWFRVRRWHSGIGPQRSLIPANVGVRSKLRAGTAFPLSYHEHGRCIWSLGGGGPRCPWDTVDGAGVVYFSGDLKDLKGMNYEQRAASAAAYLEEYTAWCNGDFLWYTAEEPDGTHVDSCGGMWPASYVLQEIKANNPDAKLYAADEESASILSIERWGEEEAEEYAADAGRELEA